MTAARSAGADWAKRGLPCVEAHLEATADAGAEAAFRNPGGIRVPLDFNGEGAVTYAALYAVQPFGNHLVTLTLTGAQLLRLLEQQWSTSGLRRLQVSKFART